MSALSTNSLLSSFINEFHFIRPLWLLALVVLALMIFALKKYRIKQSSWQSILPTHLAKVLIKETSSQKPFSLIWPSIMGVLTIIALAGPSWKKLPQPVFQVSKGAVLILDLSYSMYATDLSPNRLTRARFKAIDLLDEINEGDIGLVAYAGDAFAISPLTQDINNIKLLLPSLSPDIMPVAGSNPLAALSLAGEMLENAGHFEGDIYWVTDGIDLEDVQDLTEWARAHNYRLNILGVGTKQGAPIKLSNGELMKADNGAIVLPKLPTSLLSGVATRAGGNYATLSNSSADIEQLLTTKLTTSEDKALEQQQNEQHFGDQWQDMGPYLLLPVLVLMLGYFRRGALLSISASSLLLSTSLLVPSTPAHAGLWQDLWKTQNQQAQQKFDQQKYTEAANEFNDPQWKASAHYKAGEYEQALAEYQKSDSATSLYNQGNSYAQLQQFEQAISAYEQALAKDPSLEEAAKNKKLLEQLQQQQQNQQNQQGDENSQEGSDNSQQQQSQNQDQNQQGQNQNQQGQQEQNSQQQNSPEQNNSESNNQEQNANQNQQQSQQQEQDAENQNAQADKNSNQNEQNDDNQSQQAEQENAQQKQPESDEKQALAEAEQAQSEADSEAQSKQAQQLAAKLAQEKQQKNQQLLNKVTDDPYLLLRNKMQLEYKKRRLSGNTQGDMKKW